MIFRRIALRNFGIFYGVQGIELGPGLYVIHGENGRGKTTILNAVKWAFFGRFYNRQGKPVSPDLIINQDAKREGVTTFSVELVLEDDGTVILVRRTCELAGPGPVDLYVERDGRPLNQAESGHTLRNLFDEQVARFFLFDGEQLREYEELLFEEEDSARLVKTSIEQILGLPVLENAIQDLAAVDQEIGKRIARFARQNERTRRQGLQAEQLQNELADAEADLAALDEQRALAEREIAEAEVVLQRYESSQEMLKQDEAIETELEGMAEMRAMRVDERARALSEVWKDVLASAVASVRASLGQELAALDVAEMEARDAARLQESIDDGCCLLCHQVLAEDVIPALRAQTQARSGSDVDTLERTRVQQSVLALAAISESGRLADAVRVDEQIAELDTRSASKSQELRQIRETAQDVPKDAIRAAAVKRDAGQQTLGQIKHLMNGKSEDISRKRATVHDLLHQIAENSESVELAAVQAKQQNTNDLVQLFEIAKAQYREELRVRVEARATEIFKRLTTEPAHTGLRINANYGLETLGPDGDVAPGRSAGQEQIVALALIGALNQNATRRAPVMMDTPFGRLDRQHRAKVLAFLADMADQVFLLVHSAEVSRHDLDAIASEISAELDLHRTSAFQTDIRPTPPTA